MQFSGWRMPNRTAPMLGQHTRDILSGSLGLAQTDLDRLAGTGVVTVWPAASAAAPDTQQSESPV
jgi:hypothetical protein